MHTSSLRRLKLAGLVVLLAVSSGCGLFTLQDPYERWAVTIVYQLDNEGGVEAAPSSVEVNGPSGEFSVRNSTDQERGFVIEDLSVYEAIEDRDAIRFRVTGFEDGETYEFYDDQHPDGPRGEIVVSFVRLD